MREKGNFFYQCPHCGEIVEKWSSIVKAKIEGTVREGEYEELRIEYEDPETYFCPLCGEKWDKDEIEHLIEENTQL